MEHLEEVLSTLESFRSVFTANLYPLEVTWKVFRVTLEVYYVRFQREEVGFHMSFTWKLLTYNSCFIPRNGTKILWTKSLSINRGRNSGEMRAKFDKSYCILTTGAIHGCWFKMAAVNLQEELMYEFIALFFYITHGDRKFLLFSLIDIS